MRHNMSRWVRPDLLDPRGRTPWLFKAHWDGDTFYGEIEMEKAEVRLLWSDGEVMAVDLADAPIRKGGIFTLASYDLRFRVLIVEF